jgi:hypothetical protein
VIYLKKYFFLFLLLFSVFSFSSAKILTTEDSDYYLTKENNKIFYPFYSEKKINYDNIFETELPLKYENRISTDFKFPSSWYVSSTIYQNLHREITLENNDLINFYFKSSYEDKFYAQFTGDFQIADTSYYEYENYSVHNIPQFTYMSLDFPKISYLSLREDDFSFVLGRNKVSIGPLKYDLLLSEAAPYYDNFTFKYDFDNQINYRFSWLSSIPFMSEEEYSEYFENQETLSGYRNDFVNTLSFNYGNNHFGISNLNHVTENLPNPFEIILFSDRGLFSFYYLNESYFDVYFEGVANYSNFSKGFGIGISKTLNFKNINIKPTIEYYYTQKELYSAEYVYDELFYRSFLLSNTPGARLMFDYPFGLKYGDNSNITSISMVLFDSYGNGYVDINYDFGIYDENQINYFSIKSIYDLKFTKIKLTYNDINNNTKIFNLHLIFDLKIGI